MYPLDTELAELIARGKAQGRLSYNEVNAYLPDEATSPEKLDALILALDEEGIELVDDDAEASSTEGAT
ncbi:MAG: RNA polymerase sigma factor region1.1 domain-containing protein, partial [Pirellulales bacterium]